MLLHLIWINLVRICKLVSELKMRFTTKTEYGLVCLVQLAKFYPETKVLAIKELVDHERYSLTYVEKIFQKLRAAGIVDAHRGMQGGYSLARPPAEISLKHVVDALEGGTFDVFCEVSTRENIVCTHLCLCGMKPVWKKTKQLLDEYYGSITLDMIAKQRTIPSPAAAAQAA